MIAIDTKTFDKIAEEIFKVFQQFHLQNTFTDDGAKTYASIILNRMNTHTEFDPQDIRYTMNHIVEHDKEVACTLVRKYIAKLI
jgi:predicted component of type VI protein secretion system